MDFLKYLDPIYLLGDEKYYELSSMIIRNLLDGYLARLLSLILLICGLWFVYRRKLIGSGMVFVSLAVLIVFGQSLLRYFNWNF